MCGALDHFSRHFELLGGATRRTDRARRPLGARPGARAAAALHAAAPGARADRRRISAVIDDDVRRLVARSGCPGMRVLLFGFDPGGHVRAPAGSCARAQRLLCRHARQRPRRCVGGARRCGRRLCHALPRRVRCGASARGAAARRYGFACGAVCRADAGRARSRRGEPHEHPGTAGGNWVWRLLPGQADAQAAARLLARTQAACRA